MWAIFKLNVLNAMVTGQFKGDPDSFAEFYANEYDKAIKSGGDLLYGVNVINGNVKGMSDAIKIALKKGTESVGENFNILQEIYPSAFDAYWLGAEMAPLPNPLLKPGGWPSTPPAAMAGDHCDGARGVQPRQDVGVEPPHRHQARLIVSVSQHFFKVCIKCFSKNKSVTRNVSVKKKL